MRSLSPQETKIVCGGASLAGSTDGLRRIYWFRPFDEPGHENPGAEDAVSVMTDREHHVGNRLMAPRHD